MSKRNYTAMEFPKILLSGQTPHYPLFGPFQRHRTAHTRRRRNTYVRIQHIHNGYNINSPHLVICGSIDCIRCGWFCLFRVQTVTSVVSIVLFISVWVPFVSKIRVYVWYWNQPFFSGKFQRIVPCFSQNSDVKINRKNVWLKLRYVRA